MYSDASIIGKNILFLGEMKKYEYFDFALQYFDSFQTLRTNITQMCSAYVVSYFVKNSSENFPKLKKCDHLILKLNFLE